MVPKDEGEFQDMIKTSIECPTPVAFRYPRGKGVGVKREAIFTLIDIGKGEVLKEGNDILILAIGSTVYPALRAADRLEDSGVHAAVINSRFLKPLDETLIYHWAKKTKRVLTAEENVIEGGFGSAVLELLQEKGLISVQVKRLGIPDLFVEHGPQSVLRAKYGIDEDGIFKGAMEMVEQSSSKLIHSNRMKNSLRRVFPNPK
jgi:1-deoxy-D-xylulose-5-phosphate synthase